MSVRFQKTPQGEVAILPRADYETLVARAAEADEDDNVARLVERARAEVAAGACLLPKDVVDRLIDGAPPLRVLREWRGMTLENLSRKTGIDEAQLAGIDSGKSSGQDETLGLVAAALDVPVDLLTPEG